MNPLDPSPHSEVEVLGPLHQVHFPGYCLKCGRETGRTLRLSKLFKRVTTQNGSSHRSFVTGQVDAPFCEECIRTHERERKPIGEDVRRKLLWRWFFQSLPYIFPLGVSLWFLGILYPKAKEALTSETRMVEILVAAGLLGFFALMAISFLFMIRNGGRDLMIEPDESCYVQIEAGPLGSRLTVPTSPTSVSGAIDFTDDRSELFDTERHLFTFRNDGVAAEFAQLNADNTWNPASPRAKLASRLRWAFLIAILLFGLYQMIKDALL